MMCGYDDQHRNHTSKGKKKYLKPPLQSNHIIPLYPINRQLRFASNVPRPRGFSHSFTRSLTTLTTTTTTTTTFTITTTTTTTTTFTTTTTTTFTITLLPILILTIPIPIHRIHQSKPQPLKRIMKFTSIRRHFPHPVKLLDKFMPLGDSHHTSFSQHITVALGVRLVTYTRSALTNKKIGGGLALHL
ncbi:hypothetical protein F5Y00DRAFT_13876 [Daldinia vernicosa]|uniref:uncharacterized protein n=1 Tax=Daldinia vernicosa TaxID=114800 RepID=UPI002007B937|nr:uncharacterized protein F5Y00DRAFT_13876 [Daldinia vernicosa]KAI0851626.1 hypothetical protein F5Y00DRAFT_13876 [Daldinia vernicosa]